LVFLAQLRLSASKDTAPIGAKKEMAKTKKFYVVWKGKTPGVYNTWDECQRQTAGFEGAKFRSFEHYATAMQAYKDPGSVPVNTKDKKTKYYVIWRGWEPGIYTDWNEAKKQIDGATSPKYKTFGSKELAEEAFENGPEQYEGKDFKKTRDLTNEEKKRIGQPIPLTLSVDAACSGSTKLGEYRGVLTDTTTEVFRVGPMRESTNNIGEFLALVHGLAYLQKNKINMPIYSDSRIAMSWIKKKRANTRSKDAHTQSLITRAEQWLNNNDFRVPVLKWETKAWGEIPADFGRK
jgi:ribonuclease HI